MQLDTALIDCCALLLMPYPLNTKKAYNVTDPKSSRAKNADNILDDNTNKKDDIAQNKVKLISSKLFTLRGVCTRLRVELNNKNISDKIQITVISNWPTFNNWLEFVETHNKLEEIRIAQNTTDDALICE